MAALRQRAASRAPRWRLHPRDTCSWVDDGPEFGDQVRGDGAPLTGSGRAIPGARMRLDADDSRRFLTEPLCQESGNDTGQDQSNAKQFLLVWLFIAFVGIIVYVYSGRKRRQRLESYKYIPFQDDDDDNVDRKDK